MTSSWSVTLHASEKTPCSAGKSVLPDRRESARAASWPVRWAPPAISLWGMAPWSPRRAESPALLLRRPERLARRNEFDRHFADKRLQPARAFLHAGLL